MAHQHNTGTMQCHTISLHSVYLALSLHDESESRTELNTYSPGSLLFIDVIALLFLVFQDCVGYCVLYCNAFYCQCHSNTVMKQHLSVSFVRNCLLMFTNPKRTCKAHIFFSNWDFCSHMYALFYHIGRLTFYFPLLLSETAQQSTNLIRYQINFHFR